MAMADPTTRDADLVLAGLHLRLGALALARAELETLAGRDALDDDGLTDLAARAHDPHPSGPLRHQQIPVRQRLDRPRILDAAEDLDLEVDAGVDLARAGLIG